MQFDQIQVEYCHITAPISGRVGLRLVDPGNLVTRARSSSTANPLLVITQVQPITVIFTIPEDSLGAVRPSFARMPSWPSTSLIALRRRKSRAASCWPWITRLTPPRER